MLGPRNPDTLESMNNLAAMFDREGRYAEAEKLYRENSALLELRTYQRLDFKLHQLGEWRWASVLIPAEGEIEVHDLGAATDTAPLVQAMLAGGPAGETAPAALYRQLLGPFAARLAKLRRLYIGPDALLYELPFGLLRDESGNRVLDSLDVRLVQTGRDLLRPPADHPAKGLVAVGGIDFDAKNIQTTQTMANAAAAVALPDTARTTRLRSETADSFRNGFSALRHSKDEVEASGDR